MKVWRSDGPELMRIHSRCLVHDSKVPQMCPIVFLVPRLPFVMANQRLELRGKPILPMQSLSIADQMLGGKALWYYQTTLRMREVVHKRRATQI